jgi:hypothetical protein
MTHTPTRRHLRVPLARLDELAELAGRMPGLTELERAEQLLALATALYESVKVGAPYRPEGGRHEN